MDSNLAQGLETQILISEDGCSCSHGSVKTYMSNSAGKIPHVLIVDRDLQQLRPLVAALRSIPYDITVLEHENQAYSRAQYQLPDLIVLDLRLPERQGLKVARMLKENPATAHIPLIFLSSLYEENDRVMGLRAGAVDYILKPYYVEEVQERIHIHITLAQKRAAALRDASPTAPQPVSELLPANLTIKQIATEFILSRISDSALKGSGVAATLGLSMHRLNMVFEAVDGITVFEFIRNERMTRAARMLEQTTLGVADIATEVGYPNSANFSTEFKKFWQKSPKQYRVAWHRSAAAQPPAKDNRDGAPGDDSA